MARFRFPVCHGFRRFDDTRAAARSAMKGAGFVHGHRLRTAEAQGTTPGRVRAEGSGGGLGVGSGENFGVVVVVGTESPEAGGTVRTPRSVVVPGGGHAYAEP